MSVNGVVVWSGAVPLAVAGLPAAWAPLALRWLTRRAGSITAPVDRVYESPD
jgi:hypothetical protein